MEDLAKLEIFEIEVLEKLNSKKILDKLLFGGGTMLRLCYDLNRYSVDLDFWLDRVEDVNSFYENLKNYLEVEYEVTDAEMKHFTLLFEVRKPIYPRRLKIEIRKEDKDFDFQGRIAYSKYSNKQVLVKSLTLEQMMKNKIEALLGRSEIRDAFDMEFLLKRGIRMEANRDDLRKIRKIISGFTSRDYKVSLGSLLDSEDRKYYVNNNFKYLLGKIDEILS
ncbi:MAG: nucleotidyl transferase AbiEii/AbiGii toxin family protein [Actinobacteria bacterium]|nr:nucleotidyl transferase AbiEii/AbiGii toxin family protein [Actinomycetota bacterium]